MTDMTGKLSVFISFAAFLVAWATGLAAGVPPGTILVRSLLGAAGFFLLGLLTCRLAAASLGFPTEVSRQHERDAS